MNVRYLMPLVPLAAICVPDALHHEWTVRIRPVTLRDRLFFQGNFSTHFVQHYVTLSVKKIS
eukprot:COSAG05_NODE_4230_length_1612_cov_5.541788_2_plen_62_part_00